MAAAAAAARWDIWDVRCLLKILGMRASHLLQCMRFFSQLNHSDYSSPIEAAELEQDVVPGSEQ